MDKLQQDLNLLEAGRRLIVESPVSIESYKLSHPLGALLVVYRGSTFEDNELANAVKQHRLINIAVMAVVRNSPNNTPVEEWVEFVINSVSALTTDASQLTTVTEDEWLKEENGVWWYGITVSVPTDFLKTED